MMSSSSSSSDVTDIFELAMLAKGYEMVLSLEEKEKKRKRRRIARNRPPVETPLQTPNYNYTPQPFLLPYSRVDCTLRALAGQAEGFGRFAIGGLHGPIYRVTTLSDDGPGSLRDGCGKEKPLWIVFEVSGTIELSSNLNVLSYKTIDGRGQRIKLTGKGLRLKECEHVIICNLEFEGGRGPGVDGIHIKSNSKHIWIDRCSLKDYDDGLINITRESTNITISRCYFSNHDKTMLIGADASHHDDRSMCVTIHRCFFDGTRQRHPRVRFAKVHLYNNYTRHWGVSAVCASVESQIFSQFNIYEAGQHKVAFKYLTEKAGDKEEARTGCIISEGDHFMLGTQPGLLEPTATSSLFHPIQHYQTWTIEPATNWLQYILLHYSGWQAIARPPGHDEIPRPLEKSRATKVARSSSSSDVSSKRDEFNDGVAKELRELRIVKTMEIQFKRRFRKLEFLCTPTNDMEPEDRAEVERIKAEIRAEFDAESNN